MGAFLRKEGIHCEILNAKQHEREGAIIAQAGKLGAVTVATNMAGRGVDIILGGNPQDPEQSRRVLDSSRHQRWRTRSNNICCYNAELL